jgi:2,5-diamino-6-(ribosylamino)-4(3H)-pyrimidinone 5'-phosphate reductase
MDSSQHPDALEFPSQHKTALNPYLPSRKVSGSSDDKPFITLTYAASLDSRIAAAPGQRTLLSGAESKAMTHFLRSQHDAILVGAGTAAADDPGLNCRLRGAGGYGGRELEMQPRPIVVDPRGRWAFTQSSRLFSLVKERRGRAPFIVAAVDCLSTRKRDILSAHGGKCIIVPKSSRDDDAVRMAWRDIFRALKSEGIKSVMVEGGGDVINTLLDPADRMLIDSVIVTIAPTWLGQEGVAISPRRDGGDNELRLNNVMWLTLGQDAVLCGHPKKES